MPLIDVMCKSCEAINEAYRSLADYPKTPACPACGGETVQAFLPKQVSWTVDPVVVFQAPDGTYRFPGSPDGLSAKRYEQQGMTRLELRGAEAVHRFERKVDQQAYAIAQRKAERRQEMRESREAQNRSELRRQMSGFSEFGRAVARAAMARNDAKPRERPTDGGFHVEVYHYDRSNREESRGPDGRRRRS